MFLFEHTHIFMDGDASATRWLEWCTTVCSLVLIAISLFLFIIFVNSCFRRGGVWCAAYGCSYAYNRESQAWDFFGFRSSRCSKSRSWVLVDLALVSCSSDDQYVQYSAKRCLQCGLRTTQLFGLDKRV